MIHTLPLVSTFDFALHPCLSRSPLETVSELLSFIWFGLMYKIDALGWVQRHAG